MGHCSAIGVVVLLAIGSVAVGCSGDGGGERSADPPSTTAATRPSSGGRATADRTPLRNDQPWPMHAVDSRYRGANALGRGDVDGDGRDDYVTNYEFDQRLVVAFAPTEAADLVRPWPTMTWFCPTADVATRGCDTESASLADLDGDGNLDIAVSQGGHPDRLFDGDEPGIRFVWGPAKGRVRDPEAWVDGGRVPATVDQGHYLWQQPFDVNGDGATDLLVGGRVYFGNSRRAGIAWLEAPAARRDRRDLGAWKLHLIDPDTTGGHGFVLSDLDGDGAPDLIEANADFDTPEGDESLAWYRNPGASSPDLTEPWAKVELLRDPGFYVKPQIVVADVDGDGRDDLVTQTIDDLVFLLRRPGAGVRFEERRVRKPDSIRWPTRGLKVTDLDGDGRPELIGALTHDDGVLPADKASVYWLSFDGGRLADDAVTVHPIKWSPGTVSATSTFGEKWDQLDLRDVDGDGDDDLVANDEEWAQQPDGEYGLYRREPAAWEAVSLVWFENRLDEHPPSCRLASEGTCRLPAEEPTEVRDGTWIERNSAPGAAGGRYLQAFNGVDPATCPATPKPEQTARDCPRRADGTLTEADSDGDAYEVRSSGGRYDVWVRLRAPSRFGNGLGGRRSDSVLVSVDEGSAAAVGDVGIEPDRWVWAKLPTPVELPAGRHTVVLRVRERGTAVDELAVTPPGEAPPGTG